MQLQTYSSLLNLMRTGQVLLNPESRINNQLHLCPSRQLFAEAVY